MGGAIQHFSHEHTLGEARSAYTSSCKICNQLIIAFESFFGCPQCFYVIHKICAEFPEHINNSLHLHPLSLFTSSFESSIRCFYCDESFTEEEYAYTCKDDCAFYMHAKCGSIPQPTIISSYTTGDGEDDDSDYIQFSCHQHPMALVVEARDGSDEEDIILGKKCIACQLPWSYPAYSCTSLSCPNFFHKFCVDKLPRKVQHPFHSHKPLSLQISKLQSCDLCCKKDCRLIFSCCEIGCTFKIGTECAFLDTIVNCRSHDHLLCLVEGASCDDIKCDGCQKSYKELDNHATFEIHLTRSFLFRCMECNFNLHFICGPLPSTIKYKYHIHNLTLLDSVVEDNCHEYYCDVCEEERNSNFRVYSCSNCQYVAHIHCLIHQIKKLIKGVNDISNDVELWALGENRWKWDIGIDEKNYNNNTKTETIRDLMNYLTQEEKEKLLQPWTLWGENFSFRRSTYDYYKNANSRFHQLGSIEDFETISEFFQKFDSLVRDDFDDELFFYTPKEGIEIEEKYLRQKVREVDGKYKVPNTLTPILKTLLDGYEGDLGEDSSLSPAMKSVTATLLLIVIDQMCRTKIEDVTWDDLQQWYFYLHAIYWIADFKVCQYLWELRQNFIRKYWTFKVIRLKQVYKNLIDEKVEYLKAESKRLKAESKRLEENLDEFKKIDINGFLRTALPRKKMAIDEDFSVSIALELKHKTVGDSFFSGFR
ncbi:uncharacterized protein LOC133831903 [Humulus lupulus]|uniref:uncharacterized protein LOC133831903 n=1 Tax=Humulus lupulus TaxID=3486 RepID=UPI002B407906|nr:uncharacterized protein LOC133831903 [Humulus lupulus]